jgi:hypothetical protein
MKWDEWSKQVRDEVEIGARNESSEDWSAAQISKSSEPREIKRFKQWFLKAQKAGLVVGLVALVFIPLSDSVHYRVGVLGFVMVLGLRLSVVYQDGVNIFQDGVNGKLTTLTDKLRVLGLKSEVETVHTYADFARCQPAIMEACEKLLQNGQDLNLDLLVVAAIFSWPFFEAILPDWSQKYPNQKINFNIAMVCPKTLREWGVNCWAQKSESTASVIKLFATTARFSNLSVRVTFYDQIPFLHGVLINNSVLFRGKTEWLHGQLPNGQEFSELRVGSQPYERFSVDNLDERSKVTTFRGWIHQVRIRGSQLES